MADGRRLVTYGFSEAGRGAETMVIFRFWVLCLLASGLSLDCLLLLTGIQMAFGHQIECLECVGRGDYVTWMEL